MRQSIRLYIDGKLADCDTSTLILLNYTREELTEPAVVKNSYSQSVTLPGTPTNNKLFSSYFRNDYHTGAGFSPLVRVPFVLMRDTGEVLERGYMKLNSVAHQGIQPCSYSVTLYGGLGGLFYSLSYRADGSKRTLADLIYDLEGNDIDPKELSFAATASRVTAAWAHLSSGVGESSIYDLVNFAPCYNGVPSGTFDAKKAVYKPGATTAGKIHNLYTSRDGYGPKTGADGYALIELENDHTEWEMQDLRAWQQRPVIRLRKLLEAFTLVANSGDYTLRLDSSKLFRADCPLFNDTWLTLPLPDPQFQEVNSTLADYLDRSDTPAAYLIGFAKMAGCVFDYDAATGTVTLMTRDAFYGTGEDPLDLSERIDRSKAMTVQPYPFAHKYYDFAQDMKGAYADAYAEKYGRAFGAYRVDTGYDFDDVAEPFFKDLPFRGAADILESNRNYATYKGAYDPDTLESFNYSLKFAFTEKVSWKLYKTVSGETSDQEFLPDAVAIWPVTYDSGGDYADFMAKPQFHDKDGKPTDGADVLLYFTGMVETPSHVEEVTLDAAIFRVTDDIPAMTALNDKPCWNITPGDGTVVSELPSFRRWTFYGTAVDAMLDFGVARQYDTPEVPGAGAHTLYDDYWRAYIEDRYHVDSRVAKCRVNLRGLQVGPALMRRLCFFDGQLWALNKITNHSLTTLDTTECEFVRVQDDEAYTNGQN